MTTHVPHGSRYDLVTRHESANLPQGAAGMMDELNNGLYFRCVGTFITDRTQMTEIRKSFWEIILCHQFQVGPSLGRQKL